MRLKISDGANEVKRFRDRHAAGSNADVQAAQDKQTKIMNNHKQFDSDHVFQPDEKSMPLNSGLNHAGMTGTCMHF